MKENKKHAGRPKGCKCSDETKQRISEGMKFYYAHMTPTQRKVRENCNNIKREIYIRGWREYYESLENNEEKD